MWWRRGPSDNAGSDRAAVGGSVAVCRGACRLPAGASRPRGGRGSRPEDDSPERGRLAARPRDPGAPRRGVRDAHPAARAGARAAGARCRLRSARRGRDAPRALPAHAAGLPRRARGGAGSSRGPPCSSTPSWPSGATPRTPSRPPDSQLCGPISWGKVTCRRTSKFEKNSMVWGCGDLILVVVTFGIWLILRFVFEQFANPWRCTNCGNRPSNPPAPSASPGQPSSSLPLLPASP